MKKKEAVKFVVKMLGAIAVRDQLVQYPKINKKIYGVERYRKKVLEFNDQIEDFKQRIIKALTDPEPDLKMKTTQGTFYCPNCGVPLKWELEDYEDKNND